MKEKIFKISIPSKRVPLEAIDIQTTLGFNKVWEGIKVEDLTPKPSQCECGPGRIKTKRGKIICAMCDKPIKPTIGPKGNYWDMKPIDKPTKKLEKLPHIVEIEESRYLSSATRILYQKVDEIVDWINDQQT